jgi:alkaline phosphatase
MHPITKILRGAILLLLVGILSATRPAIPSISASSPTGAPPSARNIIVLIADGWGYLQLEAAEAHSGDIPAYRLWSHYGMTTYPQGGSYDPVSTWNDFAHMMSGATDSAAAATAMFTGQKTQNGRISVSADGLDRYYSIAEKARAQGKRTGAATSVYASHATPGAWMAHNAARGNGYAIADEGLWGDPNTTGSPLVDGRYDGGLGLSFPPLDVLLGAGHPAWNGGDYVNAAIRDRLATDQGTPGAFTFVERVSGSPDGGDRLLTAAADPGTTRLAGLFGGSEGNLDWRTADGSGANAENPTLAEMTQAALTVLNRSPVGFVLLIEGGAIDWAGHGNHLDRMIGELLGFNEAFQEVDTWVIDPSNGSSWENTLVLVTGDHETGYLTAGPGIFPDQPLGEVTSYTLSLEKSQLDTGLRASWEDTNSDDLINNGETVYWAWNSTWHTNALIPLYARGPGADLFTPLIVGTDPVRGPYVDNTALHTVMDAVLLSVEPQLFLPLIPTGS